MPEFRKWKSINKFSDAYMMAQRFNVKEFVYRGKIKLHGCFSKDALVTLANGEQDKISNLTVGTSIVSYNENTQQVEFDEIVQVMSQDLEKNWVKLIFDNDTVIECTEDHLFLTKNRGWVEAKELSESDDFVKLY